MANLTITNFDPQDGLRRVDLSEQSVLTSAGADTVARLTILGRITADGKYCFYSAGNNPVGSATPVAILLNEVVADGAGDDTCSVLLAGEVEESKIIIDGANPGVGITAAIKDSLRTFGIHIVTKTELNKLDTQD
jgi:hypothetical protein